MAGSRIPLNMIAGASTALLGLGGIGYAGYNSIFEVKGGERAIIFNRLMGVRDDVLGEGYHLRLPWFEWPVIFDIRTRPREVASLTGSRDLQMVQIGLRVLTRPNADSLPSIYRELGEDYDEKVLPSIIHEVLKQVIAQFNAPQLLTQREQVSRKIRDYLTERSADFNIVLEDVSITELQFGREFMAAVEAKQVAQQEAERARFVVDRALQDKRSIIIRAQGEAKAAELIGKSIANNPGFVQLRRIDTAREIASTMARSANTVFLNADSLLLDMVGENGAIDVDAAALAAGK